MNKTLVIAKRDYLAAVKSKGFIVGIILMPVMMFGSVVVSRLTKDIVDVTDKRVAVIDRTPDEAVYKAIAAAAERRNTTEIFDEETKKQKLPKIIFERLEAAPLTDAAAVDAQRADLSEQVRKNQIFAFIEIGKDLLDVKLGPVPTSQTVRDLQQTSSGFDPDAMMDNAAKALGDDAIVRYSSNRPTYGAVRDFLRREVTLETTRQRALKLELPQWKVTAAAKPPLVSDTALYDRKASGEIKQEPKQGAFMSIMMPLGMLLLMFVVVIIGSSQLATNVVEEKQLRIAEVLLGSVQPFQLMLGKLIGGVGVALTLAAVYIIGAYIGAREFGVTKYLTPGTIGLFCLFVVLSTFMYGGMFVAAGAAVTNLKEAQSLITPIMLIVMLPMFFFGQMINDPSGAIARTLTFFPFSAPMVTVMRLGIPPGLQPWEIVAAIGVTLLTTLFIVWAAGRVFRVGILMQGQPAKIGTLLKWIVSG